MYKIILIALVVSGCFYRSVAQTTYPHIKYTYDAAGNLTDRELITVAPPPPQLPGFLQTPELTTIEENTLEKQAKVYPVPAQEVVHVDFTNYNTTEACTMTLFTTTGSVVYQTSKVELSNRIDLTAMQAGSYFLRVIIEKQSKVWTIIKQ